MYDKYLVSVMVTLFLLLPAMHYIENILICVGIAQNSHSISFCQLLGTDAAKESEHSRATGKSNVEKPHGTLSQT